MPVATSVARALAVVTVLVSGYVLLPLDAAPAGALAVLLAFGLLAFAALVVRQVTAIRRAHHPVLRAGEAMSAAIPLFVLLFAATYLRVSAGYPGAFSEPLDRIDALYFTVATFATVGYGDITAVTPQARLLVTGQMVANLLVLGLVVDGIVGTARRTRALRDGGSSTGGNADGTGDVRPA